MVNSRQKGSRTERFLAQRITAAGWTARRTGFYQSQAGHDAADVECKDLPIHWECKGCERLQLRDWMAQAIGDCRDDQMPVVAWKSKSRPWIAALLLDDLLMMLQHTDLKSLSEAIVLQKQQGPDAAQSVTDVVGNCPE